MAKTLEEIVAEYFTGPDVAHQSIMLQMPAKHTYGCAERFFKARAALGITGYMNAKEALAALRRVDSGKATNG